jgi:hypothetical protein
MFEQLDDCHKNDPQKYMEIVKKIRDGKFDKQKKSDSDSISPDVWRDHFSHLLGPKIEKNDQHLNQEKFLKNNIERHNEIFEQPLTKKGNFRSNKKLEK